jgi:hypothetical protein
MKKFLIYLIFSVAFGASFGDVDFSSDATQVLVQSRPQRPRNSQQQQQDDDLFGPPSSQSRPGQSAPSQAQLELEKKLQNPNFNDSKFKTHAVEGKLSVIKAAIIQIFSDGAYKPIVTDILLDSEYLKPDSEGMIGLFTVSTELLFEIPGKPGKPRYPVLLLKGQKGADDGRFVIVFAPNLLSWHIPHDFAQQLESRLDVARGKAENPNDDLKKIERLSKSGVRESPDKVDFENEDFPFKEISGKINIIYKALEFALRQSLAEHKAKEFQCITSTMPAARKAVILRKDLSKSEDPENFYEGFRIVFYDDDEFSDGISALAVFGEPYSSTGTFDLVFNPELELDIEKFMATFNEFREKEEKHEKLRNMSHDDYIAMFKNPDFKRKAYTVNRTSDIRYVVSNAYSTLLKKSLGYFEFPAGRDDARRMSIGSNINREPYALFFEVRNDSPRVPVVMIMVDSSGKNVELILSNEIGVDAETFFAEVGKYLPK